MTTVGITQRSSGKEAASSRRAVADLSAVGSLADDVLRDLSRSRLGKIDIRKSEAISAAVRVFAAAAESSEEPLALLSTSRYTDTLRRMTSINGRTSEDTQSTSASSDPSKGLARVLDALRNVASGKADESQRVFIAELFEQVSQATLTGAEENSGSHRRSWSTT